MNSLGAKLRSSDLALAQLTAKWRSSLKTFEAFQQRCEKAGFGLALGLYLKNMVAFVSGQSKFLTVGGLGVDALKSGGRQLPRNGVRHQLHAQQRWHRQTRSAVIAVHAPTGRENPGFRRGKWSGASGRGGGGIRRRGGGCPPARVARARLLSVRR